VPGLLQSVPRPAPGRWLYILLTQKLPQTLTESYSGTVRFDPPVRTAAGPPHGACRPVNRARPPYR
jgi:hypothetical protein